MLHSLRKKSATLDQVVNSKEMIDVPLNGRNYLALANLSAGAIPSFGSRDQTFSAYGNNGLQNAFLLDGGRNENYLRGLDNRARDMIRPPLDALSEFTVQTSNFSAEFGASAGGVVNAITKSGTNTLHGSVYEFLRNDHLDARNFFALTEAALDSQPIRRLARRSRSKRTRRGSLPPMRAWATGPKPPAPPTVPTAAQRNGAFGSIVVDDPATTRANPGGSGSIRDPFPGNTIPASRFKRARRKPPEHVPDAKCPGLGHAIHQ